MSDFYRNEKIILPHGFKDDDGKRHTKLTIRVPTYGDEVLAGADRMAAAKDGEPMASSPEATNVFFIARLIESWEGIPRPTFRHVMALRRADVNAILEAINRLEEADAAVAKEDAAAAKAEGGASPK